MLNYIGLFKMCGNWWLGWEGSSPLRSVAKQLDHEELFCRYINTRMAVVVMYCQGQMEIGLELCCLAMGSFLFRNNGVSCVLSSVLLVSFCIAPRVTWNVSSLRFQCQKWLLFLCCEGLHFLRKNFHPSSLIKRVDHSSLWLLITILCLPT